jgi:arylsulfatase I/J
MVVADDLGWGNVGWHHDTPTAIAETPYMTKLVQEESVELDRLYAHSVCSPSRASYHSGRLPAHVTLDNSGPRNRDTADEINGFQGISRAMLTIGEKLKAAGYATVHVGKWDVGMGTHDLTPEGRGFDRALSYFTHGPDYWNSQKGQCTTSAGKVDIMDLWKNGEPWDPAVDTGYAEDLFKAESLDAIADHQARAVIAVAEAGAASATIAPFYLNYNMHLPHLPEQITEEYTQRFRGRTGRAPSYLAAMVNYIDDTVNELVTALKQPLPTGSSMWDDTVFVFFSDNGGAVLNGIGNNYPLKGSKWSMFDGGIRVPAFVSGGRVPVAARGSKLESLAHVADWFGTFCALAQIDQHDPVAEEFGVPQPDSVNLWPAVAGSTRSLVIDTDEQQARVAPLQPRTEIMVDPTVLIVGEHKLMLSNTPFDRAFTTTPTWPIGPNEASVRPAVEKSVDCSNGCLFNVFADPSEMVDLAAADPVRLEAMKTRLLELRKGVFSPNKGWQDDVACDVAIARGGVWGPYITHLAPIRAEWTAKATGAPAPTPIAAGSVAVAATDAATLAVDSQTGCTTVEGFDHFGGDLPDGFVNNVQSPSACSQICADRHECVHYTWMQFQSNRWCFLKDSSATANLQAAEGSTTGTCFKTTTSTAPATAAPTTTTATRTSTTSATTATVTSTTASATTVTTTTATATTTTASATTATTTTASTTTVTTTTATTSRRTPVRTSTAVPKAPSCASLGWTVKNKSPTVCASSKPAGKCVWGSKPYANARKMCAAAGARLCTADELVSNVAQGTGCGLDKSPVWSSTVCAVGGKRLAGRLTVTNGEPPVCLSRRTIRKGGGRAETRCCLAV